MPRPYKLDTITPAMLRLTIEGKTTHLVQTYNAADGGFTVTLLVPLEISDRLQYLTDAVAKLRRIKPLPIKSGINAKEIKTIERNNAGIPFIIRAAYELMFDAAISGMVSGEYFVVPVTELPVDLMMAWRGVQTVPETEDEPNVAAPFLLDDEVDEADDLEAVVAACEQTQRETAKPTTPAKKK